MNIIQQAEMLKDVSDQRIAQEMRQPTGQFPLYLVSSEAKRRSDTRQRFQAAQTAGEQPTTVQEDLLNGILAQQQPMQPRTPQQAQPPQQALPPQPQGLGQFSSSQGLPQAQSPGPSPAQPRGFAGGGLVGPLNPVVAGYKDGGIIDQQKLNAMRMLWEHGKKSQQQAPAGPEMPEFMRRNINEEEERELRRPGGILGTPTSYSRPINPNEAPGPRSGVQQAMAQIPGAAPKDPPMPEFMKQGIEQPQFNRQGILGRPTDYTSPAMPDFMRRNIQIDDATTRAKKVREDMARLQPKIDAMQTGPRGLQEAQIGRIPELSGMYTKAGDYSDDEFYVQPQFNRQGILGRPTDYTSPAPRSGPPAPNPFTLQRTASDPRYMAGLKGVGRKVVAANERVVAAGEGAARGAGKAWDWLTESYPGAAAQDNAPTHEVDEGLGALPYVLANQIPPRASAAPPDPYAEGYTKAGDYSDDMYDVDDIGKLTKGDGNVSTDTSVATDAQIRVRAQKIAQSLAPGGAEKTGEAQPFVYSGSGEDPFASVRGMLKERMAGAKSNKRMDMGLALANIGAQIASGKSQYAMTNIGEGFSKGFPGVQAALKSNRASKDKDLSLAMSLASADHAYKTSERDFAFKVHRGEMSDSVAREGLGIRRSQVEATILNTLTSSRDRKEALKFRMAEAAKGPPTQQFATWFINLDPKNQEAVRGMGGKNPGIKSLADAGKAWSKFMIAEGVPKSIKEMNEFERKFTIAHQYLAPYGAMFAKAGRADLGGGASNLTKRQGLNPLYKKKQ